MRKKKKQEKPPVNGLFNKTLLSLIAQLVKNLPTMQETLGREDLFKKG